MPRLTNGSITWPIPTNNAIDNGANIDDLWHAAVNSRGFFFSASDPDAFADSLLEILSSISDRTSSASSVALNTGILLANSQLYQAQFNSHDWSGQFTFSTSYRARFIRKKYGMLPS